MKPEKETHSCTNGEKRRTPVTDEEVKKLCDTLTLPWETVREQTISELGAKDAFFLLDPHINIHLDVSGWILNRYPECQERRLVLVEYTRLFKGLYWMNFYFIHANYSAVYRDLRYWWESFSIAYLIDSKYPNLSANDRMAIRRAWEERGKGGWRVIKEALSKALRRPPDCVQGRFRSLWQQLCKHVHPSAVEMERIISMDPWSFILDSFSRELAIECIHISNQVLDCIYALIFDAFPLIAKDALRWERFDELQKLLPFTCEIIRERGSKPDLKFQSSKT